MTHLALASLERSDADATIRSYDELLEPFYLAEKPRPEWAIGGESERFGVDVQTGAPLPFDGPAGVASILADLRRRHGWQPLRETETGPVIGLRRDGVSITLEPGAQIELSGAPLPTVHAVMAEMREHLRDLEDISRSRPVAWLATGFHPLATLDALPHVPKRRYSIMREYLPTRGSGALDMMWRTATVQANFDYSSEEDALRKLRVGLGLAPLVNAMLANSPLREGRLTGLCSCRGEVWLKVDPERTGLIPRLWRARRLGYVDYVEWALDAGMFLFVRGDRVIANTGQTFRSFLHNGYLGHRPTRADWRLHLNTLFPEIRLKHTLEVRCADALPTSLAGALPALFTGIFYDERALEEAEQLLQSLDHEAVSSARPRLVREGLRARIGAESAQHLAERVVEMAAAGLARRAQLDAAGADEAVYLGPLVELLQHGRVPADLVSGPLPGSPPARVAELVARTRA
jgi:glutamate--cysteine ligase